MTEPLDDNQLRAVEEAVRDFVEARWRGQEPDIEAFVKQYPGLEHRLKQDIQAMQKIDVLFDSLVQADDADFAEAETGLDLVGQSIGGLQVKEMIGSGGMGVVYLAHDSKLERSVAVKSIPAKLAHDTNTRTRFRREAKLLASLNHPNIAVIHDIIEQDEDTTYLVLEYIPGDTLAERIARAPLSLDQALSIAQQIAEAVSAAHERGVVHRDLKPGNIKIAPDNRIKVLDFGLAKASESPGHSSPITATEPGHVLGTPAYMSPEQARGHATDARTDIWSFGCILYEMLTGRLPFAGETATDTLAHIIEREPDWDLLPRETPANIRELLRRCLEKNPDQRVQHIAQTRLKIAAVLGGSMTAKTRAIPVKSHKTLMIVAAAIIIALALALWLSLKPARPIPLAVLPFANQGPAQNEYFVDGITDEMRTCLTGINGLAVTSPHSSKLYKGGQKSIRQIARELKVDYILNGEVRHEKSSDQNSPRKVTIRVHLIKGSNDRTVWSSKPHKGDEQDFFLAYADIAKQVTQFLNIPLTEPEQEALGYRPTQNAEAHACFHRGNEYYYRAMVENNAKIAIEKYKEAVRRDPEFALAYARLSIAHIRTYHWWDHSEERLKDAKDAMEAALTLDQNLPETLEASGWYHHYGELDCERSLRQFSAALKKQPSNGGVLEGMGYVYRRQGKLEEAVASLKAAYKLNPLYPLLPAQVGITLASKGKDAWAKAEAYINEAIRLAPEQSLAYQYKAKLRLSQDNIAEARNVLNEASQRVVDEENRIGLDWHVVFVEMCDANYEVALDRLSLIPGTRDDMASFTPRDLQRAEIYRLWGKDTRAKACYESALKTIQNKIKEEPENDRSHRFNSALGIAYAGLGLNQQAIDEGKRGVELDQKHGLIKRQREIDLAHIYAIIGEHDAAIDQIEILLKKPSVLSPILEFDPVWKPLQKHPRFKQLAWEQ